MEAEEGGVKLSPKLFGTNLVDRAALSVEISS